MEIDELRITKLREYMMEIIEGIKENYEQVGINFLSNEPNNYSLDKIPIDPVSEQWIIGNIINREVYSFRSRMEYSADVITNIENIGFYEILAKTIKQKDETEQLPDIDGIQSIKCLNVGTLRKANTNTAEFDIQIEIKYMEV